MTEQAIERYDPQVNPLAAIPNEQEWEGLSRLVENIYQSDFVPAGLRGSKANVLSAILTGREMGITAMQSLRQIYVVDGKPGLSAELMVAVVWKAGHQILPGPDNDAESATAIGKRSDGTETSITWTMEMAGKAGLLSKTNWQKYPGPMLWARAVSQLCRQFFPDVMLGLAYTPEELGLETDATGAPLRESTVVQPEDGDPKASGAADVAPEEPEQGATASEPESEPVPDSDPDGAPEDVAAAGDVPPAADTDPDDPEEVEGEVIAEEDVPKNGEEVEEIVDLIRQAQKDALEARLSAVNVDVLRKVGATIGVERSSRKNRDALVADILERADVAAKSMAAAPEPESGPDLTEPAGPDLQPEQPEVGENALVRRLREACEVVAQTWPGTDAVNQWNETALVATVARTWEDEAGAETLADLSDEHLEEVWRAVPQAVKDQMGVTE